LAAANAEDGTNYPTLTEKQAQVMQEVCKGAPNKLIARMLDMSEATVKVHVRQVMLKLGVSNRTQIAVLAMKHGLFGSEAANKRELIGS
jgi:two-component system nitrate/nitrite response regulator NarL